MLFRSPVPSTILYPEAPAPRRRGRGVWEEACFPEEDAAPAAKRSQPVLPTDEEAARFEEDDAFRRRRAAVMQAKMLANAARVMRPRAKAKPRAVAARPVPESAPPDKKPMVRKVALKSTPPLSGTLEKRPRGRPKGSLGKKKRDALLEEELRRLAAVEV